MTVRVRIGSPITGYGQESRNRAARQRIPNRTWTDKGGVEHVEDFLQLPVMEKLYEPRHCRATLKVYNYSYGAIDQCKFNIVSIFHGTAESVTSAPRNPQLLPPTMPTKKAKITNYEEPSSPANNQKEASDESAAMHDTSDDEDTDNLTLKND